jgi:hypothetical protein
LDVLALVLAFPLVSHFVLVAGFPFAGLLIDSLSVVLLPFLLAFLSARSAVVTTELLQWHCFEAPSASAVSRWSWFKWLSATGLLAFGEFVLSLVFLFASPAVGLVVAVLALSELGHGLGGVACLAMFSLHALAPSVREVTDQVGSMLFLVFIEVVLWDGWTPML